MREGSVEHLAFEQYGRANNLDLSMHPLHLIYLNHQTQQALVIWKSAYKAGMLRAAEINQEEADFLRSDEKYPAQCIDLATDRIKQEANGG